MHFQLFEDLKGLILPGELVPDLPKTFAECPTAPNLARLSRFYLRTRIPTRLQSGHEYPDFEDQLSQANEQRNIFLLNYHNICHKKNKLFNLDIQVNS